MFIDVKSGKKEPPVTKQPFLVVKVLFKYMAFNVKTL